MHFANPIWLPVGAVVSAILLVLLLRSEYLKSKARLILSGSRTRQAALPVPSRPRRWLRVGVMTLAVAMGFVALARPQRGMHWETTTRKGIDVLLAIDTSKSMDADDVKPTRLERVKLAIRDLVDKFPGDRIGVIAFAGEAFVQSPMTLDHSALLETVSALDTSTIAYGGTNIGRAIDLARTALTTESTHDKAIVLLSDGEDLEGQGLAEAKKAGADGITIDTVGVGSPAGELVPQRDDKGRVVGVMRDEAGNPVRSRLDEAGLQAIASAAHGTYRSLGSDGQGLERLYHDSLAPRAQVDAASRIHRVYNEWFEVPLSIALGGILLDTFLALAWRKRVAGISPALRTTVPVTIAMLLLLVPSLARASVWSAQKAYAAGRFDEAAIEYEAASVRNPKDARLAYNAGDAAYRAQRYDIAEAAFKRALAAADPKLRPHVLYNQGDSLYRLGAKDLGQSREQAIKDWKDSIAAFDRTLKLEPKDADARFNRDFVKRKLKELEDKPPPQPNEKPDPKNGKAQQDKQGANGKDSKSGKDSKNGNDTKNAAGAKKDQPKPGQAAAEKQGKQNGEQAKGQNDPKDQKGNAGAPRGADGKQDTQQGLSAKDARALLNSLRGDERHGLRHQTGTDAGVATDDTPKKDW